MQKGNTLSILQNTSKPLLSMLMLNYLKNKFVLINCLIIENKKCHQLYLNITLHTFNTIIYNNSLQFISIISIGKLPMSTHSNYNIVVMDIYGQMIK